MCALGLRGGGVRGDDYRDPANAGAGQVRYEMDLTPDGDLKVTSQPNESNVRSFSGRFVVRGFDLEDLAGVPDEAPGHDREIPSIFATSPTSL